MLLGCAEMRTLTAVTLLLASLVSSAAPQFSRQTKKEPSTMKITTLIYVPAIEPSLKFWVDQLGFTKTVEVPDGNRLGFVILMKGDAELMIQSVASMETDNAAMAALARPAACLYIEV